MNPSPSVCLIYTIASLHVLRALAIEKHGRSLLQLLNKQHLFYTVINNQMPADQFVVDLHPKLV